MCRDPLGSFARLAEAHPVAGLGRAAWGRAVGLGRGLLAAGRSTENENALLPSAWQLAPAIQ